MTFRQMQRREERVIASLPVTVGNASGITRDISAHGVYFEIAEGLSLGDEINFSVELDLRGSKVLLECKGKVLRTEQRDTGMGVAVHISDSGLVTIQ